jgi:signal transduction histidine kinase
MVRDAIDHLDAEIAGLRWLITELRPAALDELGPAAAIEALAERARRFGLDVEVNVDFAYEQGRQTSRLSPELETAVYRIAQEALTNTRKHGQARLAIVEIVEDDTTVCVSVRDDGNGFDAAARTDGFGLLGMSERVELLDGTIEIDSTPGGGTRITATFPTRRDGPQPMETARRTA